MVEILRAFNPDFSRIDESSIHGSADEVVGWQATCFNSENRPFGSGTRQDRDEARRVACAEYIERSFFLNPTGHSDQTWLFDKYPSACGLAVGFEPEKTRVRSLVEAVERWAMTEWILRSRPMEQVEPVLNKLAKAALEPFQSIEGYSVQVPVLLRGTLLRVQVAVMIGYTANGAFVGSNASTEPQNIWTHAAVEALRHWLVVERGNNPGRFPFDRIFHFAQDRHSAEAQIPRGEVSPWPSPRIEFSHSAEIGPGVYAARTIMKGYVPWTSGPSNLFLY